MTDLHLPPTGCVSRRASVILPAVVRVSRHARGHGHFVLNDATFVAIDRGDVVGSLQGQPSGAQAPRVEFCSQPTLEASGGLHATG